MKFSVLAAYCAFAAMLMASIQACSKAQPDKIHCGFDTYFDMSIGGKDFRARIALSDAEKARGLMGVRQMGKDDGMIFVYETPQKMAFWMKNTPIELDLAYLDSDGKIRQISSLYPYSLDAVESASDDILYCIEMNRGWFAKNNIGAGGVLNLDKLKSAIEKRKRQ